jgi:hypothetical protein
MIELQYRGTGNATPHFEQVFTSISHCVRFRWRAF